MWYRFPRCGVTLLDEVSIFAVLAIEVRLVSVFVVSCLSMAMPLLLFPLLFCLVFSVHPDILLGSRGSHRSQSLYGIGFISLMISPANGGVTDLLPAVLETDIFVPARLVGGL